MAVGNVMFAILTALIAVNFIFAEENLLEPGDFAYDQGDGNQNHGPDNRPSNNENENEDEEKQERTFSVLFNYYSTCNYTQGPLYCSSCTQAVRCFSSNTGYVRNCRGLLRYCNGGRCSFFPGSECNSG